jgi:hypothetical protein
MTKRIIAVGALALIAMPSFAADLWNQEAAFHTNGGSGNVDQDFTDLAGYPTYIVGDVIVGGGGWDVSSIQTEFIAGTPSDPITSITQATLNVFANSGSGTPTVGNDPSTGTTVNVTVTADTNFTNVFYLTATGLNLNWAAGEYWVGLTPNAAYGTYGQTYTGDIVVGALGANAAGANYTSVIRDPGGAFGDPAGTNWASFNTWDSSTTANGYEAMDIQGVVAAPEPVSMAFLGLGVVGLIARRRNNR